MASCLNHFSFGLGLVRRGYLCLQSSTPLQKKLPFPLQSETAWIMDFHMVSGGSTDHRHQHCL